MMNVGSTILVVDDDLQALAATGRLLRSAGYQVQSASTGQAGRELLRTSQPDLLLLDVNLPDANGIEMCREIKADPALAHHFVVILSASEILSSQQSFGLEAGADGYITLPIANRELLARVAAFLRMQRAESILRQKETEARALVQEKERLIGELQAALDRVKQLSGLLPICSGCKKIRDGQGSWSEIEHFVAQHSEASFSHGLCPACVKKFYPEFQEDEP